MDDLIGADGQRYVNHWNDYGAIHGFECEMIRTECCHACGRVMVETVEPTGNFDRATGRPTAERWHSCPTWVPTGWKAAKWARFWLLPGRGHDSHDADNPLSGRGYR